MSTEQQLKGHTMTNYNVKTTRLNRFTLAVYGPTGITVGWVHNGPEQRFIGHRATGKSTTHIFRDMNEAVQWVYAPHALHQPDQPALRVEPCVLSNEILYQQDGGEPVVYAVLDRDDTLVSVWLTETEAQDWIAFGAHDDDEPYEPNEWTANEIARGLDN